MKKSWEEKDYDVLSNILADELEYFESPFGLPITSKQKVVEQWKKDYRGQRILYLSIKYSPRGFYCIAHWSAILHGIETV